MTMLLSAGSILPHCHRDQANSNRMFLSPQPNSDEHISTSSLRVAVSPDVMHRRPLSWVLRDPPWPTDDELASCGDSKVPSLSQDNNRVGGVPGDGDVSPDPRIGTYL